MEWGIKNMSKKAVEKLFNSLYGLTDLRQLFRDTAPKHEFNEEQKEDAMKLLDEVEKNLEEIKEEIKK